jgi:hypothetical protein
MKYIFLSFLFITCLHANAQNSVQEFGVRVSGSYASFLDNGFLTRYHSRGLSYEVGFSTHIKRNNYPLGLSIELGYAQKNVKDDFLDMGYSLGYIFGGLAPNYHLKNGTTIIFFGVGAGVLSAYSVINNFPKPVRFFNTFDVNLVGGVSQKLFVFNGIEFDLDSRFNLGLLNIKDSYWSRSPTDNKTQNYGLSIGVVVKRNAQKSK